MFPEPPRTPRPSRVLWPHVLSWQIIPELTASRCAEPGSHEEHQSRETKTRSGASLPAHHQLETGWIRLRGELFIARPAFQSVLRPSLLPSSLTPGSSRPLVTHSCPFQSLPVSFLLRVLLAPQPSSPFPPAVFLRWWFTCSVVSDSCDPEDCSLPGSSDHGDSPGESTSVGRHALLLGIFLTLGSKPNLLRCRQRLYRLT